MPMRMECLDSVGSVLETGLSGFLFGFAGGRIRYLIGPSGSAFRLVENRRFHGHRLAAGTVGGDLVDSHVSGGTYSGLASGGILLWHPVKIRLSRLYVSGYCRERSRPGLISPELRCWRLQIGNLSVNTEGRLWRRRAPPSGASQLVVRHREHQDMIRRFHDSLFAGHLGVSRTVCRLQNRVYWPGLRHDVRSYLTSCTVCLARKSPCPRRAPMGHVDVGHRWDGVAMDLLDMFVTTAKGNRYVLVMVDCFSRWTEACPLPDKTALYVADAFFQHSVCRFGMTMVIHSDQGREFENKVMQELCLLSGSHKTWTTPCHPENDGLVERFNRTLLMMLAMFAGENRDDWDDLLPAVMMVYRSSVHESMGFSPYRLMFGEECTLPMDVGLPRQEPDLLDTIYSPYAVRVRDALEVAYDQVHRHSGQVAQCQKRLYDRRAV